MGQGRGPLEDLQSCHHAGAVCEDVRVAKLPPRWLSLGAGSWLVVGYPRKSPHFCPRIKLGQNLVKGNTSLFN